LKAAVDKVTKDLGQVVLIEANLKAKKWDTTATVKFLREEAERMCKQKDEIFKKWLLMKQDAHDQLSLDELKDKTTEASGHAKIVLDVFKSFGKDVLSEFRA